MKMDKWDRMAAAEAADRQEMGSYELRAENERLRARIEKAEDWAERAVLMHSSQNTELLRILRGEA
jgi:hypothetical protein